MCLDLVRSSKATQLSGNIQKMMQTVGGYLDRQAKNAKELQDYTQSS